MRQMKKTKEPVVLTINGKGAVQKSEVRGQRAYVSARL
jgi:hypothetical protein